MIGERLEEARKRKGVTIREVAESTKIRGDYLSSMEANKFDLGLPTIYVRGFLKNYARFLGLDPDKILTDYDAHQLGRSAAASSTRPHKEALGHMEVNRPKPTKPSSPADPDSEPVVLTEPPAENRPEPDLKFNLNRRSSAVSAAPANSLRERRSAPESSDSWGENRELYIKIGIGLVGVVIISLLLVILMRALSSSDAPDTASTNLTSTPPPSSQPVVNNTASAQTIVITASDNVTLMVEQTIDRNRLYSGTLNAGERISLDKQGPVSIRFSNGSAITIEANGEQLRPSQPGVGRTLIQ